MEGSNDIWAVYPTMPAPDGDAHSATLGIQNGSIALQYNYNESVVASGLAIRYYMPRCQGLPPDAFGYRCDDTQPRSYIPGVGLIPSLNCDDCVASNISIGFNFTFYGTSYNTVNVSSNGNLQ